MSASIAKLDIGANTGLPFGLFTLAQQRLGFILLDLLPDGLVAHPSTHKEDLHFWFELLLVFLNFADPGFILSRLGNSVSHTEPQDWPSSLTPSKVSVSTPSAVSVSNQHANKM
jgi:hypothetical protein